MALITIEDLEEALESVFPNGFQIETDDDGQLVIYTGLTENEDGELVSIDGADDDECDEDEDTEVYDESDDYE